MHDSIGGPVHERDPANRVTVVIDEGDGIAHRWYGTSEVTVLTEIRVMDDQEPTPRRPRFSRLLEWPALDY